jgi:hypothetical protein
VVPRRIKASSTCKLHEDFLTTMLWNTDKKKISMLKTLHADHVDDLVRERHSIHMGDGKQFPISRIDYCFVY